MRKTKIVATIGPSSDNEEILTQMIESGMNVARLNFSHNTHEGHKKSICLLKSLREKHSIPLAIMLDTKGPEVRLGSFYKKSVEIEDGMPFCLTAKEVEGNEKQASVSYKSLFTELKKGDRVLIDDGKVELVVHSVENEEINCLVVHGGKLSDHKSVNVPNVSLSMPYMSEQDKSDILFGIEQDVDFIAASFVRSKDDVITLRRFMDYNGGQRIGIIAKIENIEGVDNFEEILRYSDGIMVARGDMGVELPFEKLPGIQKRFIRQCYRSGKIAITATQMLDSMISSPSPTRAEITDVANAVFDGTSAVMLSGETAAGKYPVQAVKAMAAIAEQAEKDAFDMDFYRGISYDMDAFDITNALCHAACTTAKDIRAKAIVALTKYGQTARRTSKFRPCEPIIAATPEKKTYHQLAISWGVYPVLADYQKSFSELFLHAIDCAKRIQMVKDGEKVVIAGGIPLDTSGGTNLLKVEVV